MAEANLKYSLGLALLQKLCREEKGNFVFSPLSLGVLLARPSCLGGDTEPERLNLLGIFEENTYDSMYTDMLATHELPLKMAVEFLTSRPSEIQPLLRPRLNTRHGSGVTCVDFDKDARKTEECPNARAAKGTNDVIPQPSPEDSLAREAPLLLLNAVYFKGSWFEDFVPVSGLTAFTLRSGERVQRKFMSFTTATYMDQYKQFKYSETDALRIVKVPHREAGFYMIVAIPKDESEPIDEVIANMRMNDLIHAMKSPASCPNRVTLKMPIFKIQYAYGRVQDSSEQLRLQKILIPALGHFGRFFSKVTPFPPPHFEAIIHKALIEVDEKGPTAAAPSACRPRSGDPPAIIVEINRPFCFWIMSCSDILCLTGICADP